MQHLYCNIIITCAIRLIHVTLVKVDFRPFKLLFYAPYKHRNDLDQYLIAE